MARKTPQEFEFSLQPVNSRIEDFYFRDDSNQIFEIRFKRRIPNLLGDFFASQIHQNIQLNKLTQKERLYLLKHFAAELLTNTSFYLHRLLHTYTCSLRSDIITLGGLRLMNDLSEVPIWVSRESVSYGIYPHNLERTLEFSRLKNWNRYSVLLTMKPVSLVEIFKFVFCSHDFSRRKFSSGLDFFDILGWVEPTANVRKSETLLNAEVRHGQTIVYQNELQLLKSHQFENFKRWPAAFVLQNRNSALVLSCKNHFVIDEAMFCGVAENWYHFVIEVLTKVVNCLDKSPVPLILPSNLAPQQYEAVRLLTGIEPIQLSNLDSIRVGALIVCKDGISQSIYDFEYLESELKSVREKILAVLPIPSVFPTKVFIRRSAKLGRPLQNAKEVERLLTDRGFYSVYPENLTFQEQVLLFSCVEVLVLESGAAFTNVLFCRKGTSVIELYPGVGEEFFWQGYAKMLNLRHFRMNGKKSFFGSGGFRLDGFSIDVQKGLIPLLESIS